MEEAMLRASDSFFLCHLFQVVVVLGVLAGSEGENRDSKSGDWVARVAERAEEPALSPFNIWRGKISEPFSLPICQMIWSYSGF